VIEHANRCGKKILMSGGGRCNFTNTGTTPENFISANRHFCKSALARYTPAHFIELVQRHGIAFHEKELGQLFCDDSSKQIVKLLLDECAAAGVRVDTSLSVERVQHGDAGFRVHTAQGVVAAPALVVATGGLSIPSMGASGFGYELAKQFGHAVLPLRAGLVPLTLSGKHQERLQDLAGVALPVTARCNGRQFSNFLLVTHRGVSGPAILQISSYWQPGDELLLDLLPQGEAFALLREQQAARPAAELRTVLGDSLPKRFAQRLCEVWLAPYLRAADAATRDGAASGVANGAERRAAGPLRGAGSGKMASKPADEGGASSGRPMRQFREAELREIAALLEAFPLVASGTEGYRTAEVTLGGVDTDGLSSSTMMSRQVPGLFFIGEVVDVTGWLGGYNFQWAWASGHAAGMAV
jgi:predicted Rossmann fold flavoprotein